VCLLQHQTNRNISLTATYYTINIWSAYNGLYLNIPEIVHGGTGDIIIQE
jgi:hypothetical protein